MNPVRWVFQFVFGCRHGQMSRVFTIKRRSYRVCFECAREFECSAEGASSALRSDR